MEQLDCRKGSVTFIVSLLVFPALPASPTHQEDDRWSSKGPSCFLKRFPPLPCLSPLEIYCNPANQACVSFSRNSFRAEEKGGKQIPFLDRD